ncbi:MAG: class I SAM-dependent methyltransferase [Methanomassiliicoccus sp.]|nr:class I SAM-dependent methyltransferase [Methanomassiliicoccus sp.]
MIPDRDHWEREYSKPDPVWKGPPADLPLLEGGRVLELGCGGGKTAAGLVKVAGEVVGIDHSRKGLHACTRSASSPRLELVEGDVRCLPFSGRSFDHVVAYHVLGHLLEDDRRRAIAEIDRVLRPGGSIHVRTFSARDMRAGEGEEVEPGTFLRGNGIRTHYFTDEEMVSLFPSRVAARLDEVVVRKRYHGRDMLRAEWNATYEATGP